MKLVKRAIALMLSFILVFLSTSESVHALADAVGRSDVTLIQNSFIKVTVDNKTGRYGIRTVEGQPIRKKDQNVNMLYGGDDPETSFTTFKIDGTDYIFGNRYKFGDNFYSQTTAPKIVNNPDGTQQIETVWKIKGVIIKQVLLLYASTDKTDGGNVNIRYEVSNTGNAQVQVGSRILLDTMVGGNDAPQFQIGTAYKAPLMVERKLVHDPAAAGIPEEDRALYKLPAYWVMRDKLDLSNPQATNVAAYGFNNIAEQNINIVDDMIVGHWNGLANTKWDYTPNPNLDFTRDTNDYGSADSAVAFYWNPDKIAPGGFQSFETIYGLGEIVEPDKVFSIRYVDQIQQLATKADNQAYENEGIFDITAEVENLAAYNMEHSKINLELTLQSGLNFVKLDEKGGIVRDANGNALAESYRSKVLEYKKEATPEEAEKGIQPKYKPGDTVAVSFTVQAKGRPWPTTRQYMLTARSPETQVKLQGTEDESIKAQYESNKTNFILLPAVGEAMPTYVYGLSPKELYSTDVKYLTVNLSNIEAYHTGDEKTAPNFDLYLKNKVTGDRYKADVRNSVIFQPTDDGSSGDMRITYRGGDRVDSEGKVLEAGLDAALPLGEYQVELDYKGDAGGDEEMVSLYDIVTSQTFLVTNNDESRIREAGILAVYKQTVDLSGAAVGQTLSEEDLEMVNSMFPGQASREPAFETGVKLKSAIDAFKKMKAKIGVASKAIEPDFDLEDFLSDEALGEIPLYNYQLFDSEEELSEFIEEDEERETLVIVRGMIKQVGTGSDQQVIVDTKTEPAIINDSVAYQGKDIVFVRGELTIFGLKASAEGGGGTPLFGSLFVKGEGTLSVAGSGFVFHRGEWTLDFYNGFDKTLDSDDEEDESPDDEADDADSGNEEDDSLNGSLKWAAGELADRLNPLRQVMISEVYFNRHTLFSIPSFAISGFSLSFNDFILREGSISFGGMISLAVVDAEIKNVMFNSKGFYGIDAALKFDLNEELGLFEPAGGGDSEEEDGKAPSGEINIVHYVQGDAPPNMYGLKFQAELQSMMGVEVELAFKKVKDGRILPDVIGFGAELPKPGVLITGATYLTAIRGAVRELADTIAGGTGNDPFPLVVQAGVGVRFGMAPAYFFGDVDLTVKRTGLKVEGKLDYSSSPDGDSPLPMLSKALLEAQWVQPWFVRVESEMDIGGWNVIIGRAGIFVGQNLEKNRIDFEGYIGARLQIPSDVAVVGGLPLASVFLGVNNDKVWGSVGVLFISLGITYYWGGGVEFGTSGEQLPDGLVHLVVNDPELGPRLLVIGQGVETVATSWIDTEKADQPIVYREAAKDVRVIENGKVNMGVGGITAKNGGRVHSIPMDGVSGNAIIEMDYDDKTMPAFTLKDASGKAYPITFDNTNTNPEANAFTQFVPASKSKDQVDLRRAYVIIPEAEAKKGGVWTLTAVSPVDTKLLNVPTAPQLSEVNLTKDSAVDNRFTASWKVAGAKEEDTINLYLTPDAVSDQTTTLADGQSVLEPGDPGLLIAKDIPVSKNGGVSGGIATGSEVIDVTKVNLMNGVEDIRGLLRQGNYYLRAELKSEATFGTKTSPQQFELVDPLAPQKVGDVKIEPAGNGYYSLSFKPGAVKSGQENYRRGFIVEAFRKQSGKLRSYDNYGEILMTEDELKPYWNAATGRYEDIPMGGWSKSSTNGDIDTSSLNGTGAANLTGVKYTGLEVGYEYVVGVTAATKPPKEADKNENYHYADRADSQQKLLPVPVKPPLAVSSSDGTLTSGDFVSLMTNKTSQILNLVSEQKDVEVEAFYSEKSIGKAVMANVGGKSSGTLKLDDFTVDGPYAIELRAVNTKTKDVSVTMLYLTVDTIAPVLYIDQPLTGARTVVTVVDEKKGTVKNDIAVSGTTTPGTVLTVKVSQNPDEDTRINVEDDGKFSGTVAVNSADPVVNLSFVATDAADNRNTAAVNITNDNFDVPAGLVLKELPMLKPGETARLEAYLKVADGKGEDGKPKFKEVPIPAKDAETKLTYSVEMGESVELGTAGSQSADMVTATATGASLIRAEYKVSDSVVIEGNLVASVAYPEPTELGGLTAASAVIAGDTSHTKLTVVSTGDMTGQQLAYKVFSRQGDAELPSLKQDLSDWPILPASGVVPAAPGDKVIVAKRTSLGKLATAASAPMYAEIYSKSGEGSFGPGGPGIAPAPVKDENVPLPEVTVNGNPASVKIENGTAVITVSPADIKSPGTEDLVISTKAQSVADYMVRVEPTVVKQMADMKKNVVVDLPLAKLVLTPDDLSGMKEELVIRVGANGASDIEAMRKAAGEQNAVLLGAGEGATISINLPSDRWIKGVASELRVPDAVNAKEVTAVVLKDAQGRWTPVPWRNDPTDGKLLHVKLTGEGSLFFVRGGKAYQDVKSGYWGKEAIDGASAKLFMQGKSGGFDPEGQITRAEYPTVLLRIAGLMNQDADASFTDVQSGSWYSRSVAIASKLGIANGVADGSFSPNAALSRMEAMAMSGRLLEATGQTTELSDAEIEEVLNGFADKDSIPAWARKPVALSIKNGIILGINGNVRPKDALTRAQAAAIAMRLDPYISGKQSAGK